MTRTERILIGLGVWVVALLITVAIGSLSVCEQDKSLCVTGGESAHPSDDANTANQEPAPRAKGARMGRNGSKNEYPAVNGGGRI